MGGPFLFQISFGKVSLRKLMALGTFLFLIFILMPKPAQATVEPCNLLRRIFNRVAPIDQAISNSGMAAVAKIFPPKELKSFDFLFFEAEQNRISKMVNEPKVKFFTDDLASTRFETKLAYLEQVMPMGADEPLFTLFSKMPAYRRAQLVKQIRKVLSGKMQTTAGMDILFQNIYTEVLQIQYPHLLDGTSKAAITQYFKSTAQARFASHRVAQTLSKMGLLRTKENIFQKFFEGTLKNHFSGALLNGEINYSLIKGLEKSSSSAFFLVPPEVNLNQWISIPSEMMARAAQTNFQTVWENEMKDYLFHNYPRLPHTDIVYHHFRNSWIKLSTAVFLGFVAEEAVKFPEYYRHLKRNQELLEQLKKKLDSPNPSGEKAILNDAEKKQRWEAWQKARPRVANDTSNAEHKFMHQIIFGD